MTSDSNSCSELPAMSVQAALQWLCLTDCGDLMATTAKTAARRNIKKAAAAAKRMRTIAHLPKAVRTALGKKGAAAAKRKQH